MPSIAPRRCAAGSTTSCIRRSSPASQIFFVLPSLFIAAALLWPRPKATPYPPRLRARDGRASADAFDRRIVTLLAFGPGLAMIALIAVSGRGTFAMWGYPLWLFLGLWIVMTARATLDAARLQAHRRRTGRGVRDLRAGLHRQLLGAAAVSTTATAPCSFPATRSARH